MVTINAIAVQLIHHDLNMYFKFYSAPKCMKKIVDKKDKIQGMIYKKIKILSKFS
jgi:hypothetical protein